MIKALPLLAILLFPAAVQAQNLVEGEVAFRKCLPCHGVGEDARNKVGPVLNGLDGRKAGAIADYSYSPANRGSGIVWNAQSFSEYIRAPQAMIPRTKMTFAGIRNEREIADLWAYLARFATDGKLK